MKVAIIGSGGIGGYFGGKIAKAGFDVTFFARGEHLNKMRESGLVVKSILGDFRVDSVKATDKIQEIGVADLIILGVKAWQVKDLSVELKAIVNENTTILPLQNGVMAVDELREHMDARNIIGGLCRIISKIESPGVIDHFAVTPKIVFGEIDNSKTVRIKKIKEFFGNSGIDSIISDNITADLWRKFISICLSGLLAVTRSTYGELRELKETRQMMVDILTEIYQLSQKIGIQIEPDYLDKAISFIDTFPHNATSSLARDVWEGKPSEIEYQNGTVVRLGRQYGVETPLNSFIYNCILPMEIKARKK
jgi:2-dehydropantoate 2-reductase